MDIIKITQNVYPCSTVELAEVKFHVTILRTGRHTHTFPFHACILSVTHRCQQHTRQLNWILFLSPCALLLNTGQFTVPASQLSPPASEHCSSTRGNSLFLLHSSVLLQVNTAPQHGAIRSSCFKAQSFCKRMLVFQLTCFVSIRFLSKRGSPHLVKNSIN
jgi:hypothetical protein